MPRLRPSPGYVLAAALALATLSVGAQVGNDVDGYLLTQTDLLIDELGDEANATAVRQVGNRNSVEVIQRQLGALPNTARVLQRGDANAAQLVQAGYGNQVILLQRGNRNRYTLDLAGSGNDIAVVQNGDANEVRQRHDGARDLTVEFIQDGDANLIDYQTDGLIQKDITIRQDGDGLRLQVTRTTLAAGAGGG